MYKIGDRVRIRQSACAPESKDHTGVVQRVERRDLYWIVLDGDLRIYRLKRWHVLERPRILCEAKELEAV